MEDLTWRQMMLFFEAAERRLARQAMVAAARDLTE